MQAVRNQETKSAPVERFAVFDGMTDFAAMYRDALFDEPLLQKVLSEAHAVPQMIIHAQLFGDEALLQKAAPFIEGGRSHVQKIPLQIRKDIRNRR